MIYIRSLHQKGKFSIHVTRTRTRTHPHTHEYNRNDYGGSWTLLWAHYSLCGFYMLNCVLSYEYIRMRFLFFVLCLAIFCLYCFDFFFVPTLSKERGASNDEKKSLKSLWRAQHQTFYICLLYSSWLLVHHKSSMWRCSVSCFVMYILMWAILVTSIIHLEISFWLLFLDVSCRIHADDWFPIAAARWFCQVIFSAVNKIAKVKNWLANCSLFVTIDS